MSRLDDFKTKLHKLVLKVPTVEWELRTKSPGKAGRGKPEEITKDQLLTPFLDALGFDAEYRTPEASIRRSGVSQLTWVDYVLKKSPNDYKGLALFEAKSILDENLWDRYKKQVRGYLHDYQLSLRTEDPVRWIILTNFRELYILNIADYEPFFKMTFNEYMQNASLLFRLFDREQLINDQITSIYYEKRSVPLGKSFLNDLKLWRLLLANGFKQSQPELSLSEVKTLSQQILNRIIFIRVLETFGLHPYYSLVRQYENWRREVRNTDRFPFFNDQLMKTFVDIELDLNTDLFKNDFIEDVCKRLTNLLGNPVSNITMPNKYIRPLVDPDVYWPEKDQELRELVGQQTGQQRFALNTPYNYDFHTLTQDIIGQVYEQFLAHNLIEKDDRVLIRTDQTLRQKEGAYYTPTYLVNYLVNSTIGRLSRSILDKARHHLSNKEYQDAQASFNEIRRIKVIDLACGSGSFLIASYNQLLEVYKEWNHLLDSIVADVFQFNWIKFIDTGLIKEDNAGDSILTHNIFGVDRDPQAVGEARLNMWLLLLRTQTGDYMRVDEKPPKRKLPDLSKNFIVADSLDLSLDMNVFLGKEPQTRIVLGNPPWGANVDIDKISLGKFTLAKGQYDSYDLFIERVSQFLREGDLFGYVVPDSMLQLPQHTLLREFILKNYEIESLIKLGEGVFEDVFRAAIAFVFKYNNATPIAHKITSRIIVKSERDNLIKSHQKNPIQNLIDQGGIVISQSRFKNNKEKAFDIFASDEDTKIIEKIDQNALKWEEVTTTGRGVELSKNGQVIACPYCGIWRPIPQKQKNGTYKTVQCSNCGQSIHYEDSPKAKIIMPYSTKLYTQPIIVGEGVNRYQIVERRFIDITKVKKVAHCPNPNPNNPKTTCSFSDTNAPEFFPGEVRTCEQCGKTYMENDVREWTYLGINYKSPQLFNGEKLLVRKTGRGIYATIDKAGAYTTQVVFIFKLRSDRPAQYKQLRLSYILGVINSQMMLYRYYKALGDIEWKSFPYMTQKIIMTLPVRAIDFTNNRQTYYHDRIADLVDTIISNGGTPNQKIDEEIEKLVRELYGVNTPATNARIDSELEHISQLGSLLGSSVEEPDEESQE